jgi:YegS/Rv2252/BmrU family lipid kinase
MAQASQREAAQVFIVLNPMGGTSDAPATRDALTRHLGAANTTFDIYETTGAHDERIDDLVRAAVERGCELVAAVGGDGTVSEVAGALARSDVPLGIIPAGTANVLARELGVPVDLEGAVSLIAGDHEVAAIDGLEVDGRIFVLGIGIGIESIMIRDTPRDAKRRFGRLAYLWTAFTRAMGFSGRRYTIMVDGERVRPRAVQVLIANGGTLGVQPLRWGPGISPRDGRVNVVIVSPRSPVDYLKVAWAAVRGKHRESQNLRYLTARESVIVTTDSPLPVQADGEIIGNTPVHVHVAPGAVKVVVPRRENQEPKQEREAQADAEDRTATAVDASVTAREES